MTEAGRMDLMATGIAGLDHLLHGGIVRGNSLLIEGPPGSGKTTLAIRSLYEGIVRFNEPGLILSFEEFPKQIYQEARGYGVDLEDLEQQGRLRVIWTPPDRILQGFKGESDLVEEIVSRMGVRRLVIDSITHFKRVSASETELRETLAEILKYLKIKGINAILVKELERMDDATIAFEEYLVDASLRLYNSRSPVGRENRRYLEIRKTRGQAHISGLHPFQLSDEGVEVHPRLRPEDVRRNDPTEPAPLTRRLLTGIRDLDTMLHGGLWTRSFNLAVGEQGTGKSVLAYHFIQQGIMAGEICLLTQFDRSETEILAEARSVGLNWQDAVADGRLLILSFDRVGLIPELFINRLHDAVMQNTPSRFVLENLNDLLFIPGEEGRGGDRVLVLRTLLESAGATSLIIFQSLEAGPTSAAVNELGDHVDCVLQLSLADVEGSLRRFLGVRKHRGSDHVKARREFTIDGHGLRVTPAGRGGESLFLGDESASRESLLPEMS